jgi:tellurite resistance protein
MVTTMKPPAMVQRAAVDLCARFDLNDYNPTPLVDLGALVANADGSVDTEELEALRQLLEPMLGAQLNAEMVGYLIEASLRVIEAAGIEPRVRLLANILLDCDAVEEGIIVALAVAHASDGLSAAERALIESIAREAHLPADRLERLNEEVRSAFAV